MVTFFDMILQAQRNTRAKQFRKDSLRAVLAVMGGQRDVVDNLMTKFSAIGTTDTPAGQFIQQVQHEAGRVNGTVGHANELEAVEYQKKLEVAKRELELMRIEHQQMDMVAIAKQRAKARAEKELASIQDETAALRANTSANNKKVLQFVQELDSPEMKRIHDQRLLSEVSP